MVMMSLVVLLATIDIGVLMVRAVLSPPKYLFDVKKLLDVFSNFVLILIGLELLESFKAYLSKKEIHVEVVLTVALIAVAHKILLINIHEVQNNVLFGIAALVAALSIGYYLLKRIHQDNNSIVKPPEHP